MQITIIMDELSPQNIERNVDNQQTTFELTDETLSSAVDETLPVNITSQVTTTAPVIMTQPIFPTLPASISPDSSTPSDCSTSPDNLTTPDNSRSPDSLTCPGNLASPDNPTSSENLTSPDNSASPDNSTSLDILNNPISSVSTVLPVIPPLPITSRSVNSTSTVSLTLPMTSTAVNSNLPFSATLPVTSTSPLSPTLTVTSMPSVIPSSAFPYEQTTTPTSDDASPRCGRCRSLGRSLCRTSPDRYCCFIPAKIWLKIRLFAIVLLLVGLFLVIIFPLPGMVLFQIAVALLTVSALFVFIDIGRGALANCWCDDLERPRTQTDRVRTIEVTANTGFEDYDNPAFAEGDHPPDYASAIASSPAPLDNGHQRQPNITINIESSDHGTAGDVAFDPTISPSSLFSFNEPYSPRSLPPSYDDVIKEDNDRQRAGSQGDNTPGPSSS